MHTNKSIQALVQLTTMMQSHSPTQCARHMTRELFKLLPLKTCSFLTVSPAYKVENLSTLKLHAESKERIREYDKPLKDTTNATIATPFKIWLDNHVETFYLAPHTLPSWITLPDNPDMVILPINSDSVLSGYYLLILNAHHKISTPPPILVIFVYFLSNYFESTRTETEMLNLHNELKRLNYQLETQLSTTITELQHTNHELVSLTKNLEIKVETAVSHQEKAIKKAEKMAYQASLSTLSLGISHEINNPLAIIKTELELLKDDIDQTDLSKCQTIELTKRFLNCTESNIKRILTIIQTMTRYGISDTQHHHFISIASFLNDFKLLTHNTCKKHNIELKIVPTPQDLKIRSEETRLNQLMLNVLTNSIDAINKKKPNRGKVKIKVIQRKEPACIVVKIIDNGCGIEKTNVHHIQKPFITSKNQSKGQHIGLGLTICKRIMINHNGDIVIRSKKEWGTVIELKFPISQL